MLPSIKMVRECIKLRADCGSHFASKKSTNLLDQLQKESLRYSCENRVGQAPAFGRSSRFGIIGAKNHNKYTWFDSLTVNWRTGKLFTKSFTVATLEAAATNEPVRACWQSAATCGRISTLQTQMPRSGCDTTGLPCLGCWLWASYVTSLQSTLSLSVHSQQRKKNNFQSMLIERTT